ncbi:MAG: long-chain fatty acid--CoA ligase [Bacteroidales bacterium]|nr:long-chain fatty acid--CoA ligase [Bacteroidales bacterium]
MELKRIYDIMLRYEERHPEQKIALSGKIGKNKWNEYTPQQYKKTANELSCALLAKGIAKGDKVALISTNRPEWTITQMAVTQIGAVLVPIYPTITAEDYKYILNHCEAKLVILEGEIVMRKVQSVSSELTNLKDIYTFVDRKDYPYWDQLLELGRANFDEGRLSELRAANDEKECAMIIYTSGTTGTPKGVMLSHYNIMSQLVNLCHIPSKWSKKGLSFLPLCHAYENMIVLLYQYLGMTVYYVSNLATIAEAMREVHPSMMTAVPRVLEKFYEKIEASGRAKTGAARSIFEWAVKVALKYNIEPEDRTAFYNMQHALADKLVYSKIRQGLGADNFDIVVSGAASLKPELCSFFSAMGMPVFEGYGMTETSPVIAVSCREKYGRQSGTVGFPLGGVDVAITKEGEVICRGHNIMMGYYKDEAQTKEIIDEAGWLHTGDMGRFTERGQLALTGRLKNIFKTSMGKYVNPQVIEEKMAQSKYIDQIVVVGENQKFVAALIVPDFSAIKDWCESEKIVYSHPKEMVDNLNVKSLIKSEIDKYNKELSKAENVMRFEILADEWTQDNGLLTPTLKVKRSKISKKYAGLIQAMFEHA